MRLFIGQALAGHFVLLTYRNSQKRFYQNTSRQRSSAHFREIWTWYVVKNYIAIDTIVVSPNYWSSYLIYSISQYGFNKIRKGPDVDMYSHPGFVRGNEDGLSQLRKRKKAPLKEKQAMTSSPSRHVAHSTQFSLDFQQPFRVISPAISTCGSTESFNEHHHTHSLCGPLQHSRRNSERLTMLADLMIMMIEGE